jgi:antitoxin CptB
MVGGFVARHIHAFTEAELDELEAVLELPDVDLSDWLAGRREIPAEVETPMLRRLAAESAAPGAGRPADADLPGLLPPGRPAKGGSAA